MSDNVTEEFKQNPCYWCRKETELKRSVIDGFWVKCSDEEHCWATGPKRETEDGAILAWNSLAARLKPEPKKRTLKRWVSVYSNGDDLITGATFGNKCDALEEEIDTEQLLDTVEVEITFTDRRNL